MLSTPIRKRDPSHKSVIANKRIIVVGIPKCGTTSLQQFFLKLGFKSVHYNFKNSLGTHHVGQVMEQNKKESLPLLGGALQSFNAFTQMDCCDGRVCTFPQMTMLTDLLEQYPDAYYILNTRNIDHHIHSIMHWSDYAKRLSSFGQFGWTSDPAQNVRAIGDWISNHNRHARTTFSLKKYAHVKFLEIAIDEPDVAKKLCTFLGLHVEATHVFPKSNTNNNKPSPIPISYRHETQNTV